VGRSADAADQRSTVDLKSQFVAFNIKDLKDERLKRLGMFTVLEYIWTKVMNEKQKATKKRVMLYIDEAHILMSTKETAEFVEQLYRQARKYNVAVTVITQMPEDFMRPDRPEGQVILGQAKMRTLLKLELPQLRSIQNVLGLDEQEIMVMSQLTQGNAMIIADQDRALVSMRTTSVVEHEMITTNAEEIAEARQVRLGHRGPAKLIPRNMTSFDEEEPVEPVVEAPPAAPRVPQIPESTRTSRITGEVLAQKDQIRRTGPPRARTGPSDPPRMSGDRGRTSPFDGS
jgi:hypothetical protein